MKSLAMFFVLCAVNCQAQPAGSAFEASVGPTLRSRCRQLPGQGFKPPGMLTVRHSALSACILFAWQFQDPFHMIGPAWIHELALDITAKAATPAGDRELALMLKSLLKERSGCRWRTSKNARWPFSL